MKDGLIEVLLQRNETGEPLEEREGFVLGSVGDEYHVRVVVHRDATTKNFPFNQKTIKVGLYVDNIDVQYWKRLDLRCDLDATEVIFWGFKQSKQDIKTFVMTTPKALKSSTMENSLVFSTKLREIAGVYYKVSQSLRRGSCVDTADETSSF